MSSIVATTFVSADGVAEVDPVWHFPYFDESMGAAVTEDYSDVDALLLGRITYESFAGAWPDRETAGGEDAEFARQLGDLRKLVATRSRTSLGWRHAQPVPDLLEAVAALRKETGLGKVLVPGSISVVQQLLAAGELDELRLLVHPVLAGHGRQLFAADSEPVRLQLVSSEAFASGVLRLIYRPSGSFTADGVAAQN